MTSSSSSALLKTFRARAEEHASKAVDALMQRALGLDDVLTTKFDAVGVSLSQVQDVFMARLTTEALDAAAPNDILVDLVRMMQDELGWGITQLWYIERWISLQVPAQEDGNNFGVEVQSHALKIVQERSDLLSGFLSELCTMFWQRGNLFDKITRKVHQKTSTNTQSTSSNANETSSSEKSSSKKKEAGDDNEESESSAGTSQTSKKTDSTEKSSNVVETKEVIPRNIPDYVHYLVAAEVKWWASLRDAIRQVQDSYLVVCDTIDKNRKKIAAPKGEQSSFGMY